MAVRRKELLEVVSPPLLEHLRTNADTMVIDKASSVTISDILASACGDLRPAMTAVAQLANQDLVPGGIDGQVGVLVCVGGVIRRSEHGGSHHNEWLSKTKSAVLRTDFLFLLQLHMAEHPAGHLVLKWLLEQDMTLAEAGKEGKDTHTYC